MTTADAPLQGPPPAEIPLKTAPLVRVIAQLRFPLIASVDKRDFIAPFQEAIRQNYPVLRPEQSRSLVFGPEGVVDARSSSTWRFSDSRGWRVSLAPEFVALETTRYTSRDDFLTRFEEVLIALREHVNPRVADRLGIRYIDRITGTNLEDLPRLVRPEVAGVVATRLVEHAVHAICETLFMLPGGAGQLMARWGLVPPKGTVDPAAVDAIDEKSWLLDLDAFIAETRPLDVAATVSQAREFAERIYSFFRWAVDDEFLRRYGAEP